MPPYVPLVKTCRLALRVARLRLAISGFGSNRGRWGLALLGIVGRRAFHLLGPWRELWLKARGRAIACATPVDRTTGDSGLPTQLLNSERRATTVDMHLCKPDPGTPAAELDAVRRALPYDGRGTQGGGGAGRLSTPVLNFGDVFGVMRPSGEGSSEVYPRVL